MRLASISTAALAIFVSGCSMTAVPTPTATSPAPAIAALSSPVPTLQLPAPTRTLRPIQPSVTPTQPPPTAVTSPTVTEPPTAALTETTAATAGIQVEVAGGRSGLRLRALPDTRSEQLASLTEYTTLTILGRTSDNVWLRVATPEGDTGWIMVYFLNVQIDLDALDIPVDVVVPVNPPTIEPTDAPMQPSSYILGITPSVREIFVRGQQLGNRADVFSKVGDSITVGTYFLYPVGWGAYNLRDYGYLGGIVGHFSAANARDGNSFSNHSLAADNGWTSSQILDPARAHPQLCASGETPLECEYRVVRPSVALIMIGTNDLTQLSSGTFSANLDRIIEISLARGVIPAVSTIPPRAGFPADEFNRAIRGAASRYSIPLWDYGAAMAQLPNSGLSNDGVHPSWPPGDFALAADFTAVNLRYGYTLRNLMALQMLDAVWRAAVGG